MAASQNGHESTVRALVELGAQVDAVSSNGWTALMFASQNGHESTVRALVERGAQVDAVNSDGETALMLADENGHESTVHALEELSAPSRVHPALDGDDSECTGERPCLYCCTNVPKIRFEPCGHVACRQCSTRIQMRGGDCPMCRETISRMQTMFL